MMTSSKYNARTILVPGRNDNSFAEHGAILDAIRQKDAATAESCMRVHVGNMRKTFEEYYSLLFLGKGSKVCRLLFADGKSFRLPES